MNELLEYYADRVPMYMTLASLAMVSLEWIALTVLKRVESHKEGWINVLSAMLSFFPVFALNLFVTTSVMFVLYEYRLFDLGLKPHVWILAYFAYDFMSYALHYLSHKVRFLWCIHSAHHSPREMKASVAFRGSFADVLISPHLILWLPLLGFHPLLLVIVEGAALLYGVRLHLNANLVPKIRHTWLRKLFITPSAHRLHHAKNDLYLDTNYGLTFSFWDQLFKTYQPRSWELRPEYGVKTEVDPENLLEAQTDEFVLLWRSMKMAPRWQDKLKYLVMPPGWNHEDGGTTSAQIRAKCLAERAALPDESASD